jgi:DNA-binding NtrC family response regulator
MLVNDLDNPRLRDEDIIAALGYEPVGFADAKAALLACEAAPERFDATVISHFASPARALQLAVKLRHAAPQLPVILVAATDEIDVEALAAAGIVRFIARPLAMDELAAALNQCLMP